MCIYFQLSWDLIWYNLCGGNFLQPILHCHKFSELSNDVLEISDKEFVSSFTRRHFLHLANDIVSTFTVQISIEEIEIIPKVQCHSFENEQNI